jgi:hypothetical protein
LVRRYNTDYTGSAHKVGKFPLGQQGFVGATFLSEIYRTYGH